MPPVRAAFVGVALVIALLLLRPAQMLLALVRRSPGWALVLSCRALLVLLGVRIETVGRVPPLPGRLVVANHVSWIDILALASVEPLCFLAKREVGTWPLIGPMAIRHGTVFVDRRRRRTILAANAGLAARLAAGRSALLFPEGTTTDGRRCARFLTSHLACLARPDAAPRAVQPVALAYSDPVAAWIGDATLLPHVWAVLRRPGLVCRLSYGDPIAVAPGFDRKALGRDLKVAVEDLLAGATQPFAAPSVAGHVRVVQGGAETPQANAT